MKRLRTHITRLTVAILVCTGLGLYMIQPVQSDYTSESFANWLDEIAKSSDGAELQKELDDLRNSASDLQDLFKEVSQTVNFNNSDFAESLSSQHLYQLWLIEWSNSKSGNAMDSVPVQHISKLIVSATIDKSGFGAFSSYDIKAPDIPFSMNTQLLDAQQFVAMVLVPMVNSIAIGAP